MMTSDTTASGANDGGGVAPTPPVAPRRLRRSTDDRVVSGVCGGLGEYFELDPVLFRILFATAAFFGGIGVVAYLLAWFTISEPDQENTVLDQAIAELRRRKIPVWVVLFVGIVLIWGGLFSWWTPWGLFPVLIAAAILIPALRRRGRHGSADIYGQSNATSPTGPFFASASDPDSAPDSDSDSAPAPDSDSDSDSDSAEGAPTVSLSKDVGDTTPMMASPMGAPTWAAEGKAWVRESRVAAKARRRRAAPLRWTTFAVLLASLATLSIIDQLHGIAFATYFWTAGGIVVGGLLLGLALRRTPWSLVLLLPFVWGGLFAFAGSSASLHDGVGAYTWAPHNAVDLKPQYRLAFGETRLDLSHLTPLTAPRTVDITMGAGQVTIITRTSAAVQINASILRGGQVERGTQAQLDETNGRVWFGRPGDGALDRTGGIHVSRQFPPADDAVGAVLTVNVHLADGNIRVEK